MILVEELSKDINHIPILKNITYQFDEGKVYGIKGENGSGKTMLLRAIAGLIIPDKGRVIIDGKELHKDCSFPPSVGLIIENMQLLPEYDAIRNLEILASIKKKATKDDIINSLKRVGLNSNYKVKKYSLGMKQRLNIAQAIFEKPELILLDEPTNALDKKGIEQFCEIVNMEKERGATILIAYHMNENIDALCDEFLHISGGEIVNE